MNYHGRISSTKGVALRIAHGDRRAATRLYRARSPGFGSRAARVSSRVHTTNLARQDKRRADGILCVRLLPRRLSPTGHDLRTISARGRCNQTARGAGDHRRVSSTRRFAMAGSQSERAAVILAGGDGTRLSAFTREMFGEEIPKQFCRFRSEHTLLEQTWRRGLLIDPAHTITVLTASHARFFVPLLEGIQNEQVVVQSVNRGTAPAILYSLTRLKRMAPDCSVALFPSDHFVDDDREFMRHVEAAFRAVDARPEKIVLLGVEPTRADPQYGWIEPGEFLTNECEPVRQIRRFWEKPPLPIAD